MLRGARGARSRARFQRWLCTNATLRPAARPWTSSCTRWPAPTTSHDLRFASKKHWSTIAKQLREIYTAPSIGAAEVSFEAFAQEWEPIYPAMVKSWRDTWEDFEPFLEFPAEIRKIVYSTNAIESLNARFRKAAVRRGHFPTEQAALKVLYLTSIERRKNRQNPTGRVHGWKAILNTLSIHYAERLAEANY